MLISVETDDLDAASATLVSDIADPLDASVSAAMAAVAAACDGMAGDDPVGVSWSAPYDAAATSASAAAADAVTACFRLGSVFAQASRNYSGAEALSIPRRAAAELVRAGGLVGEPQVATFDGRLPSSGGCGVVSLMAPTQPPLGWARIAQYVQRVWPNGHQDRLRAAANGWRQSADALADVAGRIQLVSLGAFVDGLPEGPDMDRVCTSLSRHVAEVAVAHRRLERACLDYAQLLDTVHAEVERELLKLITELAGTELLGGLLAVTTAGFSEAIAQGVVLERVAAVAGDIARLIDGCAGAVRLAAESIPSVDELAAGVTAGLRGILAIPLLAPEFAGADGLTSIDVTFMGRGMGDYRDWRRIDQNARDIQDLLSTDETYARARAAAESMDDEAEWRDPARLLPHYNGHGDDFGSGSPGDYARRAGRFFKEAFQRGLPMKIGSRGLVRIYDYATNTFASFTSEGKCMTIFKPEDGAVYWDEQPGTLIQ